MLFIKKRLSYLTLLLVTFSPLCQGYGASSSLIQTEERPSPPNPKNLSQTWWEYYNVEGDELNQRIANTIDQFGALQESLSPEEKQEAFPYIERIISILQTLPDLRYVAPSVPLPEKKFLSEYSLDQFIQLGMEFQECEQQVKISSLQKDLTKDTLESGNKYLDTIIAAYLIEPQDSPKKLLQGLEIMAEKLSLEVDQFQLRYENAVEQEKKQLLDQVSKEIAFARAHLAFPTALQDQMQKDLKVTSGYLRKTISDAFIAQLEYTKIHTQENASSLEKTVSTQKLIQAMVEEARAQMALLVTESKNHLHEIYLPNFQKPIYLVREEITSTKQKIDKITRLVPDWQKSASLDLENAIQALSFIQDHAESQINPELSLYQTSLEISEKTLLSIQKLENDIFLSQFLLDQLGYLVQEKYPSLADKVVDQATTILMYIKEHGQWLRQSFFKIGNTPITLRAIIKFVLILIVGYLCAKFVQKFFHRLGKKHNILNESALYTLSRLAYFFIIILGVVVAVASIGIDFTAFAFVAGALTFWIGFGLLSIIQNFVSGIIVLLDKNIRVGDYIILDSGEKGIIADVNVRTTVLESLDGHKIYIPNSDLVTKKFTNQKISDKSYRLSIPFKFSYKADREMVCKTVIETALQIPYTHPVPPPQVWLVKFEDESINASLIIWVDASSINKQTTSLESIYLWAIDKAFQKNGLSL